MNLYPKFQELIHQKAKFKLINEYHRTLASCKLNINNISETNWTLFLDFIAFIKDKITHYLKQISFTLYIKISFADVFFLSFSSVSGAYLVLLIKFLDLKEIRLCNTIY